MTQMLRRGPLVAIALAFLAAAVPVRATASATAKVWPGPTRRARCGPGSLPEVTQGRVAAVRPDLLQPHQAAGEIPQADLAEARERAAAGAVDVLAEPARELDQLGLF